jgi:hypothetical protein
MAFPGRFGAHGRVDETQPVDRFVANAAATVMRLTMCSTIRLRSVRPARESANPEVSHGVRIEGNCYRHPTSLTESET